MQLPVPSNIIMKRALYENSLLLFLFPIFSLSITPAFQLTCAGGADCSGIRRTIVPDGRVIVIVIVDILLIIFV